MIDSSIKQKEKTILTRDSKHNQKLKLDDQLNQLRSPKEETKSPKI